MERFAKSVQFGNHCVLHMDDSIDNSTGKPVNMTDITAVKTEVLLAFFSLLVILALISLIGNIISVVAICRANALHKPVFVFQANIACADILQNVTNIPYTAASILVNPTTTLLGPVICSLQTHIAYGTISTIICFIAITAVYRMMQICYTSNFPRISSVRWMLPLSVLAWCVPVVLLIIFSGKAEYNSLRYSCYFNTYPLMIVLSSILYVPMCVLFLISYIKVMMYVYRCRKRIQVHQPTVDENKCMKKELIFYKPLIIIFVIFLCMFAIPGMLFQLAKGIGQTYRPIIELSASAVTKMRPVFNLTCNIVTSSYLRSAIWENFHFKCNRK